MADVVVTVAVVSSKEKSDLCWARRPELVIRRAYAGPAAVMVRVFFDAPKREPEEMETEPDIAIPTADPADVERMEMVFDAIATAIAVSPRRLVNVIRTPVTVDPTRVKVLPVTRMLERYVIVTAAAPIWIPLTTPAVEMVKALFVTMKLEARVIPISEGNTRPVALTVKVVDV